MAAFRICSHRTGRASQGACCPGHAVCTRWIAGTSTGCFEESVCCRSGSCLLDMSLLRLCCARNVAVGTDCCPLGAGMCCCHCRLGGTNFLSKELRSSGHPGTMALDAAQPRCNRCCQLQCIFEDAVVAHGMPGTGFRAEASSCSRRLKETKCTYAFSLVQNYFP